MKDVRISMSEKESCSFVVEIQQVRIRISEPLPSFVKLMLRDHCDIEIGAQFENLELVPWTE